MNKDELKMIEETAEVITQASDKCLDTACEDCKYCRADDDYYRCKSVFEAEALHNANYRKIAVDEIIIKKSEYKELKKYRTDWLNDEKMHLQAELEDTEFELGCSNRLFQKVCKEKEELEEQLERYKNKAKHYYNECKLYGNACYIDNDLEDNNE